MAGIDTEFLPCFTKFDKSGVALIQIATAHNCYLFDGYNLAGKGLLGALIEEFFADESIVKVVF